MHLSYLGVGAGTVAPGVLGRDLTLDALIYRTGHWFIVVASWSHSVLIVVVDVGMLGLKLVWFG